MNRKGLFKAAFAPAALAAAATFALGATAQADEIADFFKGKQIKVVIGSGAGGGYDTYARLLTKHMGNHIPGNPTLLPQNMVGAGGVIATNFMVNVAPQDGTVIGAMQRGQPLVSFMGKRGPKYKISDIQWLGSLSNEAGVCALSTQSGAKSLEDIFKKKYAVGGTGPNTTQFFPALFNNLLGAKFKMIKGYPSTADIHLAIERGEVDGVCQSWASFKELNQKMLDEGRITPLVQVSLRPDKEMTARKVPMLASYFNDDNLSPGITKDDAVTFFSLTLVAGTMGRPFGVSPGVPKARVAALRKAFVAMTKDPAFLADAKKIRRDIELVTGDEIQEIIGKLAKTPQNKFKELDEHLKFKGETSEAKITMLHHSGKVVGIKKGGRTIVIDYKGKETSAGISGSRTKVTLDGKKAKRKAIKLGMTCEFVYTAPGQRAQEVNCKK
jgi:tripartite-type tricarboxylate transporter receptor subunit TctC